jgi:competence protein ComEC
VENQTKQLLKFLILPLALGAIVAFAALHQRQPDFLLHADFLDVGQGDAIFVQTFLGRQLLIDGGPGDAVLSQLGSVMPFFDRTLDAIMLTHPDADHVSGLIDVLRRYQVKNIILTGATAPTATDQQFEQAARAEGAHLLYVHTGDRIWLDQSTVFDVYWPLNLPADYNGLTNETSIMGKLTFGRTSIMFTGDADAAAEQAVTDMFNVNADILKVSHHGSKTSSTAPFLSEVSPAYAVIEVGAHNTYGHPAPETLAALSQAGSQILRTDEDHTVKFVSDGSRLYRP